MLRLLIVPYLLYNVAVGATYAYDKWQARRGGRRVPERTLLVLACAFGALGALVAMRTTRHKTRTLRFAVGVPFMLCLQVLVLMLARR